MSATSEQLGDYYTATLISQYFEKPKAIGTIEALIVGTGAYGLVGDAIANQVREGFDLETAVGKQLDFLGKLRGVTRFVSGLDLSKEFLPLVPYDDVGGGPFPGISTYDDLPMPPATYIMTYEDFLAERLQDGDFRRVIQFLAQVHSCDYSYETLDSICYAFFTENVNIKVTGTMEITYQHLTSDTDNLFSILNQMGLLPVPAGVKMIVSEVGSF